MSRNLCDSVCYFCGHEVALLEAARPIRMGIECPAHWNEYEGMLVAAADCPQCEARYLAWMSRPVGWPAARDPGPPTVVLDLSFRSTFNDEPGALDLPRWSVREGLRIPFLASDDPWSRYWRHQPELELLRAADLVAADVWLERHHPAEGGRS